VFDVLAIFIAVFFRHDDVCDYYVGFGSLDFTEGTGRVMACNYIDVFAAESDLDDLAHGGAVVNEIDSGDSAHTSPPSGLSCLSSSNSRNASSINSVADRRTVRVVALSPGTNSYEPVSIPLLYFTMWTTASSPIWSPTSAWVMAPLSKKTMPSMLPAFT